ncbi:type I-F CRISPR-associated endoribonuclease Cas6/Csy4 [Agarivorans gilvus]|uniref:type I-F CRISPR-associated endoribonuclease Cas6/Csy4 n=1 Tax=Agarivorans gilvus TaxID=680279 RepID=UPI0006EC035D
MIERYYFIVRYLPKRADCSLLAGRCIKELHHIFSQTEESIAVSFPEWTVGSLGPSIGFVSSSVKYLEALRNRSYFIDMQEIGAFELTKVLTVPNEVGEVRFIRNQRVAKLFSGEFRRRYARGKKRPKLGGKALIRNTCQRMLRSPHSIRLLYRVVQVSSISFFIYKKSLPKLLKPQGFVVTALLRHARKGELFQT